MGIFHGPNSDVSPADVNDDDNVLLRLSALRLNHDDKSLDPDCLPASVVVIMACPWTWFDGPAFIFHGSDVSPAVVKSEDNVLCCLSAFRLYHDERLLLPESMPDWIGLSLPSITLTNSSWNESDSSRSETSDVDAAATDGLIGIGAAFGRARRDIKGENGCLNTDELSGTHAIGCS